MHRLGLPLDRLRSWAYRPWSRGLPLDRPWSRGLPHTEGLPLDRLWSEGLPHSMKVQLRLPASAMGQSPVWPLPQVLVRVLLLVLTFSSLPSWPSCPHRQLQPHRGSSTTRPPQEATAKSACRTQKSQTLGIQS